MTINALCPRRPARPACCQKEATVPGKPASTTASRPAMSTPNSSALVVARPRSRPSARARSSSRRSSARSPARYDVTRSTSSGARSSRRALVPSAVSSAPRRDRTNVSVRAPSIIKSAITRAASAPAERRTGAPFSPSRSVRSAGSQSATVRPPCGEPSSVTSTTAWPSSSEAVAAGEDAVALARITVGPEESPAEYLAHSRISRRSTSATLDPKIPR